jgi:hypothetical protein
MTDVHVVGAHACACDWCTSVQAAGNQLAKTMQSVRQTTCGTATGLSHYCDAMPNPQSCLQHIHQAVETRHTQLPVELLLNNAAGTHYDNEGTEMFPSASCNNHHLH